VDSVAVMASDLPVSALLSQLLVAYTIELDNEFEHQMPHRTTWGPAAGSHRGPWLVSLAIALRILTADGVRVRDLPGRSGVSREAMNGLTGFLGKQGCVVVAADPAASRTKLVRLTAKGLQEKEKYSRLGALVEERWRTRFEAAASDGLRASARDLIDQRAGGQPRLAEGLRPYPDGWRAHPPYLTQTKALLRDPGAALPHYPMVLHRGGFPDGS
jgi:DNA-binding MarR family transcriptional regulator